VNSENDEPVELEVPYSLIAKADQVAARLRDELGRDHLTNSELLDAVLAWANDDPEVAEMIARLGRGDNAALRIFVHVSDNRETEDDEHSYLLAYARPHTIRIWEARGDSGSLLDIATVRVAELVDGRWFAERSACRDVCEWAVVYAEDEAGAEAAARHFMAEIRAASRWEFARWPPGREAKRRW
jgi:hypothetical protein